MPRTYLERFVSDPGLVLPLPHHHPDGQDGYERDKKLIRAIEREEARFSPLILRISDALKNAKPVVGDPPTPVVFWVLSKQPKPEPYFKPAPYLYVDVNYEAKRLLTLEKNKKTIGELGISLVEEALSKLASISDFPVQVIQDACDAFRENDYSYSLKCGEATIPGTQIKGRIDLEVTGAGTRRIFSASYRKKFLIRQQISEISWPELAISSRFDGFALDADGIIIKANPYHIEAQDAERRLPDGGARINLKEYPKTLELMRAKGWS